MPIGQPTKCTPERQALVVQHLLDGLGQSEAARLAGIDPATHFRWMKKGEEGGDDDENIKAYRGYCQAVKRAIAQWEAESLRVIAEHAKPHGRVAQPGLNPQRQLGQSPQWPARPRSPCPVRANSPR